MALGLYSIFAPRRAELIDAIVRDLRASDAPHYREIDIPLLVRRVDKLVGAFLEGLTGDRQAFLEYVERLAEERILEGYYLEEIQRVLNLLWRHAWNRLAAMSKDDALIEQLDLLCRTVGAAKDVLARTYLARAQEVSSRAELLEQRLERLLAKAPDSPRESLKKEE